MAAGVAALACTLAMYPAPAAAVEVLPDLVADAPSNQQIANYSHPDGTTHLLLRFDGYVHNQGSGAFEMRGSSPVGNEMTNVVQRVYQSGGSFVDDSSRDPHLIWEPEDGHNHWHLKNIARYSLWASDKLAEVAPALKVGFCLIDGQRRETNGPSSPHYTESGNNFCAQGNPGATSLVEGVSAGWRDVYDRTLAFQWVDITDVSPGLYYLRSDIDPDDVVRETNEVNSGTFATSSSTIPGYRAKPVNAGVVSAAAPTSINLATDSFGTGLGTPAFRIIEPPRHGSLNRASGPTFSGASVVYTPSPGWVGPDRFTYTAQNSTSEFPHYPAAAAVSLNVGGVSPSVALSGAPVSMFTDTSARLLAAVTAEDPYVSWTVDGIGGGSAQTGTVDAHGLYVAPSQVPPSGQATIRATTASGAFDEVTVLITAAPPPQPAPLLGGTDSTQVQTTVLTTPGARWLRANLGGLRLAAVGDTIVFSARSRRAGVVRIRVWKGERMLGHCRVRTPAGRTLTCRAHLPSDGSADGVRMVVTLRVKGRLVEVQRGAASAHGVQHQHHP
jgi:hypothetical protein